jgi:hypothetical protein
MKAQTAMEMWLRDGHKAFKEEGICLSQFS